MTYIPLKGFAPDREPTTPGILLDAQDYLPTSKGLEARSTLVNTTLEPVSGSVVGSATLFKLDGLSRTFAATANKIWEAATTTWTDRSRSSSTTYSAVADTAPWRFAQFNDRSLAANKNDALQITNNTSNNFGDVSGSIKASLIETVGDFVMLANTNDTTFGDSPNRWWCSGIGNPETFAPSLATQAATGTLAATPGAITGLHQLGNDIVAYKKKSMYLGRYVGPPAIWSWQLITEEIGAPSHEAVVSANDAHYFLGPQDFYVYDGTRPVSIGDDLKEWFYENCDQSNVGLVRGYHEFQNSRVWWFFPGVGGSGTLDSFLAYNYRTGKWGKGSLSIQVPVEFVGGGLTYDNFGARYSTWQDVPEVPYNFPPWLPSGSFFGVFVDTTTTTFDASDSAVVTPFATLKTLSGDAGTASLRTSVMGFDGQYTFGHRVRPRFAVAPESAELVNSWQRQLGGAFSSADTAISMIDGKFDFERSERWHCVRLTTVGDSEILGIDVEAVPDGLE
jgi:hypothetical protein